MAGQTMYSSPSRYSQGIDHSYEMEEQNFQNPIPAFHFRKRFGDINWRKISSIDVDRVARELDFVTLQENISTVTFCNVDAVSDLDPLFVKLFKLAQYTIEYLLHSQEYLQSVVNDMETQASNTAADKVGVEQQLATANAEIAKLKQENKKRRKMIEQQQLVIEAGASSYYKCPHCDKAFMNASFLQGHIQRRHPGSVSYIGDVIEHSQREQSKLSNNLKQLEADLQKERENFDSKLREAETEKTRWAEQSRRDMDRWKEEEEQKWKEELTKMKETFIQDIEGLKKKEEGYRKTIDNLQTTMDVRQSNLGDLVDEVEGEKVRMREYEERMETLEGINQDKTRQIEALSSAMKKLRKEQSLSLSSHQEELKREQERQMRILKQQVKKSGSDDRVAKLQEQIKKLSARKQEPKPKVSYVIEDDEEEEMVGEMPDREERIKEASDQIRPVLINLLDERVAKCGVDPTAAGLTSKTLTNKLMVLKTERQQQAKDISGYYQIREEARRKLGLAVQKRTPGRKSFPKSHKSSTLPRKKLKPVEKEVIHKSTSQPDLTPSGGLKRAKPVHREHIESTPVAPTRSPRRKEETKPVTSPWDSEDDESDITPIAPPSGRKDEGDWDDVEDLLSTDENNYHKEQSNVQRLGSTIQKQLFARGRPPVGAVDVAPTQTKIEDFDDDDSFQVSSLEDEPTKPTPVARPKKTPAPRHSVTSNSSNTFGTSVWGSGGNKASRDPDFDESDLDLDELMT